MRGVTHVIEDFNIYSDISTHTPHARRDMGIGRNVYTPIISTHTPHARRDLTTVLTAAQKWIFLLTRLMRGVTECISYFKLG